MAINYGPALDEDGPMRSEGDAPVERLRNYAYDVSTFREPGPWTGEHMMAFFNTLRDAFGYWFSWTTPGFGGVRVIIRGGASNEFADAVHTVLRERLPAAVVSTVELGDPVPAKVNATFRFNGPRVPQKPVTAAPRPGQRWRSPTGEEGRIYDTTPDGNYRHLWHLRMASGLRVQEEHADLVTAWTYVDGPTEPETARERFDRVGALMVADRPEGVTERTWQAVVAAIGEGEDEVSLRAKCAAARVALVVAERMRVVR